MTQSAMRRRLNEHQARYDRIANVRDMVQELPDLGEVIQAQIGPSAEA
jgi:hypothetical protein